MTAHPHAALMLQYAQDAAETETPWEQWEAFRNGQWVTMPDGPSWIPHFQYRRKPKVIIINGHEVPEPMRVEPELGKYYYTPRIDTEAGSLKCVWDDTAVDRRWLARGLCHDTEEAALIHANALLSFTRSDK